jgi:hypothetical protein
MIHARESKSTPSGVMWAPTSERNRWSASTTPEFMPASASFGKRKQLDQSAIGRTDRQPIENRFVHFGEVDRSKASSENMAASADGPAAVQGHSHAPMGFCGSERLRWTTLKIG